MQTKSFGLEDIDPDLSGPKRRQRVKTDRTKLSPAELAAKWGKSAESIIALIRLGDLPAIDVSVSRGRPRFLIDLADIAIFEQRRTVRPPEPRTRRRRQLKIEPECVKYF
jgi:hypothetical protein